MKEISISVILSALVWGGVYIWVTTPVVQISASTGECVNVIPEGSCENLPSRYEVEYVK